MEAPKLAEALSEKAVFSQDEWDAFGIRNLENNSFIKCGADTYFVPIALHYFVPIALHYAAPP